MVSKGVFLWIFENTFSYGTPPLAASDLILENIIKAASGCNISLLFTNCSGVFLCSSVQYFQYFFYRSSRRGVFFKKDVFKNVAKFAENHQCQSLFLSKLQSEAWNFILKNYSGTSVFLWILENFEHLFCRATPDDYFYFLKETINLSYHSFSLLLKIFKSLHLHES